MSLAFQYQDAIDDRLRNFDRTIVQQQQAKAVLWDIVRHLGWQSYEYSKTAADFSEISRIKALNMVDTLKLLEDVGAIKPAKLGRVRVINVTPEGAFRGNVNNHAKLVEKYKLDVIEGGKGDA